MLAERARAPWLGAAILALGAMFVARADAPVIELESESEWEGFGALIAADGDLLVASDLSVEDEDEGEGIPVLRIMEVREGRVAWSTRFAYDRDDPPIALDVSHDRVVVLLHSKRLDFYEQREGRWTEVHSLELTGRCRELFRFLDLADQVLVIGAAEAICIYEPRGAGWVRAAELLSVYWIDEPKTNGDRIVQHALRPEPLRLSRREMGVWRPDQTIWPPSGRSFETFAISRRWLAVTTSDRRGENREVQLYELGARATLVATLRAQEDDFLFGLELALTDDHLLVGGFSYQLFRFSGGSWRPDRVLSPSVYPDQLALGALAWIGNAGEGRPGLIRGYRLDSSGDPR